MKAKQSLISVITILILLLACRSTTQPPTGENSTSTQTKEVIVLPTETSTPLNTQELSNISITEIVDDSGSSMMLVPAGEFIMGSDSDDTRLHAQPAGQVYLDSFWIDKTEVTNKMYALCVTSGDCQQPTNLSSSTRTSYFGNPDFDNYPVIYVPWDMMKAYCAWRDARLPTSEEWEKAMRGLDGRLYPWGDEITGVNFIGDNLEDTTAVGSYPDGASVYGVLDLIGNIWEVVNYHGYETSYVLRGGSWYYSTQPLDELPGYPGEELKPDIGFRCAKDADQ